MRRIIVVLLLLAAVFPVAITHAGSAGEELAKLKTKSSQSTVSPDSVAVDSKDGAPATHESLLGQLKEVLTAQKDVDTTLKDTLQLLLKRVELNTILAGATMFTIICCYVLLRRNQNKAEKVRVAAEQARKGYEEEQEKKIKEAVKILQETDEALKVKVKGPDSESPSGPVVEEAPKNPSPKPADPVPVDPVEEEIRSLVKSSHDLKNPERAIGMVKSHFKATLLREGVSGAREELEQKALECQLLAGELERLEKEFLKGVGGKIPKLSNKSDGESLTDDSLQKILEPLVEKAVNNAIAEKKVA